MWPQVQTNRDPHCGPFNYTLVPANLIAKTEVYKTPQAKLDEGGVGGTVIIHTRKPLDMDAFSGFAEYRSHLFRYEPRA